MKKAFYIFMILVILSGCNKEFNEDDFDDATPTVQEQEAQTISSNPMDTDAAQQDVITQSYSSMDASNVDPFTSVSPTAVEFLLDYSLSPAYDNPCKSNLAELRKKVPLFFYSVAYQRSMDISLGVSYFGGGTLENKVGYHTLLQLDSNFRDTTLWYERINALDKNEYGEDYAGAINESLKNLASSEKDKQYLVMIGDGSFLKKDDVAEIDDVINDNQQVRIILFCADKDIEKTWTDEFEDDFPNVKIYNVNDNTKSYRWLYEMSNEVFGSPMPPDVFESSESQDVAETALPIDASVQPKFWLEGVDPQSGQLEPEEALKQLKQRTDVYFPILGGVTWRVHAVSLFDGGQIKINNGRYFLETSRELPNTFIDDFHANNTADCEQSIMNIHYTGLGPVIYWVEQISPLLSEPVIEMSGFPYVITANIKARISGGDNLSNLELCYLPFLKVNGKEIKLLVSPSCNSTLCMEQSNLIARFHWPNESHKNANITYGFINKNSGDIVGEASVPPPPFIVTSGVKIELISEDSRKLTHSGMVVETYSIKTPVFFYDSAEWDLSITAISEKEEIALSGLQIKGTSGSNLICPDKRYSVKRDSDRIQLSDSNPSELQVLIMSNVGWDFGKGGAKYESDEYCGFTNFEFEWKEKKGERYTLWSCHKRKNGPHIICEKVE